VVFVAGLAFGVLTILVARREPGYAFADWAIRADTRSSPPKTGKVVH
jgi:hypothetical protein